MNRSLNETGCKHLCAAVLVDAVQNYRHALETGIAVCDYESFFRSEWCQIYLRMLDVTLTGEEIIEEVKKQNGRS